MLDTHTQQNRCRFCEKDHYGTQKVCRDCIDKHRPKLSTGWLIFWLLFTFVGAFIYYLIKKNEQEDWDRKNL